MKSYTTWILFFSLAFWLSMIAIYAYIWNSPIFPWTLIGGAVCWIVGLWGFYLTERTNRRRYSVLDKTLRREKRNAAEELLEVIGEIDGLQDELRQERIKKNVVAGSHLNMEELRKLLEKGETA